MTFLFTYTAFLFKVYFDIGENQDSFYGERSDSLYAEKCARHITCFEKQRLSENLL